MKCIKPLLTPPVHRNVVPACVCVCVSIVVYLIWEGDYLMIWVSRRYKCECQRPERKETSVAEILNSLFSQVAGSWPVTFF